MQATSVSPDGLSLVNAPTTFWRGTRRDVEQLWSHRELLRAFTARELRSRYKGSKFGWVWALIRPLTMLLIYGLAVGVFLGGGRTIPQFMVFIYCGLLAWGLFATIITACIGSVVNNGGLLTRANFPRLLLPLSAVIAALVDFLLQASVLLVGYAIFKDLPSPGDLLWLPAALVPLLFFSVGLGLLLAGLNVYTRDVGFLTEVGLQVGFWLAPVLYSYGQVVRGAEAFGLAGDLVTRIYMLNPMANIVLGFQRALWPPANSAAAADYAFPGRLDLRLAICFVASLAVAWLGMRAYARLSNNFGQEL